MGMVPKNMETVAWPNTCFASSKNMTQRALYSAANNTNSAMLKSQSPSARRAIPGSAPGSWASASDKMPVPIVAANQFGVN